MLLLLFNPSVQGAINWGGSDPTRIAVIPLDPRRIVLV